MNAFIIRKLYAKIHFNRISSASTLAVITRILKIKLSLSLAF